MIKSYEEIKDIELGAIYKKEYTIFRVFSPNRNDIKLLIADDYRKIRKDTYNMKKNEFGIFECKVLGDLDGLFYSYLVEDKYEVTDPYSKASSINSIMSAIVDLNKTNPKDFDKYKKISENEAIIYELNVKDYTSNKNSNVINRGKFLGLTEENTKYESCNTGLSNLIELGISHIQLLPCFDFISTFEENDKFFDDDNYNWGYDPELYFNVEGSYSSNPYKPEIRIKEFKKMISSIHNKGLNVVMDVVYNHTYKTLDSNLEILAPGYYHRRYNDGNFSNGSGVGNELASEKPFCRKLIIDSLKYWAKEFKIDGFRFDLMALIDIDTMKIAVKELKKINSHILIYGEPWMGGQSSLDIEKQIWIGKQNSSGFSVFNDRYRNAIKGDNDGYSKGYIQGNYFLKNQIETGIAGSIKFDEKRCGFADDAKEVINYFNCHDNLIYHDKLKVSLSSEENLEEISRLGFSLIFLSFGKPFIYEGNEFNNSKNNNRNSYNLGLKINGIDWKDKINNIKTYNFVKDLILLRKEINIFNNTDAEFIRKNLEFIDGLDDYIIAYRLNGGKKTYIVIINASDNELKLNRSIKELIFKKEEDFKKIFCKKGKINKKIELSEMNIIDRYSVNVYEGGKNGL